MMSSVSAADEFDWATVELTSDPHIVLGRRTRGGIVAVRVDVHENLHDEVRDVCRTAIRKIGETQRRPYEPYAALEAGEQHFSLTNEQLPELVHGVRTSASEQGTAEARSNPGEADAGIERVVEEPALLACLRNPVVHPLANRDDFK